MLLIRRPTVRSARSRSVTKMRACRAARPTEAPRPSPAGLAYLSSVVALVLGVGLAVGVSAVFGLLGWGGELASQTAGAACGAAPLILDGVRQRRERRSGDHGSRCA